MPNFDDPGILRSVLEELPMRRAESALCESISLDGNQMAVWND